MEPITITTVYLIQKAIEMGLPVEKDNYGQFVIYTHVKENEAGQYEEMTAEDFEDEEALYKA